ncbi:MAG TPA: enoyl-CoA hydratase-related protein [Dehalococcoidia bacterium]|nr:enoyl-CoA hydratase-related protein [Dehalococcoidia bacterium]
MANEYETILYEVSGRVATITLNRPEKLNAISRQLQSDVLEALTVAEADSGIRAAVIQGAGRAFSAGYDVTRGTDEGHGAQGADGQGVGAAQARAITVDRDGLESFLRGWFRIWDLRLPVIAKVHGYCLAGGTQFASICDVTIVAEDAKVGAPQLPLGAGFVASFWAWHIGAKRAKELFFPVGSMITGREAADLGLFNRAVPAADLDEVVASYVELVAKTPKEILALQKQAINKTQEVQGFREALMQAVEVDAIAHFSPPVLEMNRRIRENGLKSALQQWQDVGYEPAGDEPEAQ